MRCDCRGKGRCRRRRRRRRRGQATATVMIAIASDARGGPVVWRTVGWLRPRSLLPELAANAMQGGRHWFSKAAYYYYCKGQ